MPITDRHLSGRTYNIKNFYPLTMLSLNEMFKESMRKITSDISSLKVITRCDNLPNVKGNKDDVLILFEELIRMIVSDSTAPAQLFLYIDCEEIQVDKQQHFSEGFNAYIIKFRTNISLTKN